MKFSNVALTLATAGTLVAAQPHRHHHRHNAQRRAPTNTDVVVVPGPTVVAYELDGKQISWDDVTKGIADGSLKWANGAPAPAAAPAPAQSPSSSAAPAPAPTSSSAAAAEKSSSPSEVGAQFYQKSSSAAASTSAKPSSAAPSASASASSSSSGSLISGGQGVEKEFPDGEIDCSSFPSDYGALYVDWLGLGGWTGVQYVKDNGDLERNADAGDSCHEGTMCSYACPAGYLKSQWPTTQGSTGQSIGGLHCKGGKLRVTNKAHKNLCIKGSGAVSVQNKLSTNVAICRTDYPGTESETIPLNVNPSQSSPLACPDQQNYYVWEGKSTSAQYYVNPAGLSVDKACQWNSVSGAKSGNWAPVNLGVSTSNGVGWYSILPNLPTDTTADTLDFDIEIVGDINGKCRYSNGHFISDTEDATEHGCTVCVSPFCRCQSRLLRC